MVGDATQDTDFMHHTCLLLWKINSKLNKQTFKEIAAVETQISLATGTTSPKRSPTTGYQNYGCVECVLREFSISMPFAAIYSPVEQIASFQEKSYIDGMAGVGFTLAVS